MIYKESVKWILQLMPISIICGECLINLPDIKMIDFIVESKRVLAPWVLSADIQKKEWSMVTDI